jgi:hypothetical protein
MIMKLRTILDESVYPKVGNVLIQHINGKSPLPDMMWDVILNLTGAVTDPMGQWKHPGKCTMIPTTDGLITMKNVPYPVVGIDETGHAEYMEPENEYSYPGRSIFEIPHTGQFQTLALQLKNAIQNGSKY